MVVLLCFLDGAHSVNDKMQNETSPNAEDEDDSEWQQVCMPVWCTLFSNYGCILC